MHYVGGVDERGQSIDVRDPLAPRLRALSDAAAGSAEKVDALLGVAQVFPGTLASDRGFRDELVEAYAMLATEGASAAVSRFGA
jgi:fructuronate reductase